MYLILVCPKVIDVMLETIHSFKPKNFSIVLELKGPRVDIYIYFSYGSISKYFRGGEPSIYILVFIYLLGGALRSKFKFSPLYIHTLAFF